jgi:hypothetical protein
VSEPLLIGADVGTQSAKAALFELSGACRRPGDVAAIGIAGSAGGPVRRCPFAVARPPVVGRARAGEWPVLWGVELAGKTLGLGRTGPPVAITAPEHVAAAVVTGADFLVTPHLGASLLEEMVGTGLVAEPGVLTPSEVMSATRAGAIAIKLSAASIVGVGHLKALPEPFPGLRAFHRWYIRGLGRRMARCWSGSRGPRWRAAAKAAPSGARLGRALGTTRESCSAGSGKRRRGPTTKRQEAMARHFQRAVAA